MVSEEYCDLRIECLDDRFDLVDRLDGHHIRLVEQDDIGELDLISQSEPSATGNTPNRDNGHGQIGDVPLVLGLDIDTMSVGEEINRFKVIHESSRVDDRDTGVQPGNLVETTFGYQFGESSSRLGRLSRIFGKRLFDILES